MPARRRSEPEDSLELLLDTICNAFGGVLFLTILLTMLLRMSHPKTEAASTTEAARQAMRELSQQLETTLAELESLEKTLAIQSEVRERLASDDLEARYFRLEQLREQRRGLEESLFAAAHAKADTQTAIDAIEARVEEIGEELDESQKKLMEAKKALDAERMARTKSVVPPRGRSTIKRELVWVLRYDRVYERHRWSDNLLTHELNSDEFIVLGDKSGRVRATPKPYRGLAIEDSDSFSEALRKKLARHRNDQWYVCIAAWEDSFGRFQEVKTRLAEWGYDIRILAVPEGESVSEGFVADPQVQ